MVDVALGRGDARMAQELGEHNDVGPVLQRRAGG